jgi:histidyl-tRNA synthetase
MAKAFEFMDKVERMRPEQIEELSSRPEAFAPATISDLLDVSRIRGWDQLQAEIERSTELAGSAEPLRTTYQVLRDMDLGDFVEVDLTIVRGLAYYTGIVFEVFDTGRTLRAICGGGRYDNLLEALGGVELPAVGFGMGDVVLAELLRDKNLAPGGMSSIDVFLAFITGEDLPEVLSLAHRLRDEGLRVEYALSPQAVGKQLKLADARNARLAAVVGPDERVRGEIVIKDLRSGSQEKVSLQSSVDIIKARVNG